VGNIPKKLLVISYRAGLPGDVLAEFADDKLRVSTYLGIKTTLVTALGAKPFFSSNLKTIQVPSISYKDFILEQEQLSNRFEKTPNWIYLYSFIPKSIGRVFDYFFKRLNGSSGHARWSWIFSAVLVSIYISLRHNYRSIYAVGSVAAYITGLLTKVITGSKLYLEIPDPIIAQEMTRTKVKSGIISLIEIVLIISSKKFIYTTKKAFEDATLRYPRLKEKFTFTYPLAWNFNIKASSSPNTNLITVVHLGTIYGTRNFDKLFLALDSLYQNDKSLQGKILVINVGMTDCKNSTIYSERKDFKMQSFLSRVEALEFASTCDYLLLLQHTDKRSIESIPYKLYDYVNLNKPLICLINNNEIEEFLKEKKEVFIANVNDTESIRKMLLTLNISKQSNLSISSMSPLDIHEPIEKQMNLITNFRLMF
jgi:hypothetical protein